MTAGKIQKVSCASIDLTVRELITPSWFPFEARPSSDGGLCLKSRNDIVNIPYLPRRTFGSYLQVLSATVPVVTLVADFLEFLALLAPFYGV